MSDLSQLTIMFFALISRNLNKLTEAKVRDFPTPEAFHAIKIQRLGDDGIKPTAQVGCQLPMEVAPLVGDFPIQSREPSDTTFQPAVPRKVIDRNLGLFLICGLPPSFLKKR